jgi:predicted dienelactone hydrolase
MVPAYALMSLCLLLSLRPQTVQRRRAVVVPGILGGVFALALAFALPAALPVFALPAPAGPYAVGTTYLDLVDTARPETFTADPQDRRELLVQIWYPAAPVARGQPVAYLERPRAVVAAAAGGSGVPLPAFVLDHLKLVRTHAYRDAPLAADQSRYPVLVFSHGYLSYAVQNTVLMEELASHGYVVASISHPYEALVTSYPDGRDVPADDAALAALFERGVLVHPGASLRIWTDDTRFVLDQLESVDAERPGGLFAGRLDLARLGVLGMSFGGTTACQVCAEDARCRASLDLDGDLYGARCRDSKPFAFLLSSERRPPQCLTGAQSDAYLLTVRDTKHRDFGDFPLYSPLMPLTGYFGTVDARRMTSIMNAYTRAFFDRHLRGQPAPLLDGPAPEYPEVEYRACPIGPWGAAAGRD